MSNPTAGIPADHEIQIVGGPGVRVTTTALAPRKKTVVRLTQDTVSVPAGAGHSHDGTGTNSTIIGGVAEAGSAVPTASGAESAGFGDYAAATGLRSMAFGPGTSTSDAASTGSATTSIAAGYNARITSTQSGMVLIGTNSSINDSTGGGGTVVGASTSSTQTGATIFGSSSSALGSNGGDIVIGTSALGRNNTSGNASINVVIGSGSQAQTAGSAAVTGNVLVGGNVLGKANAVVSIGRSSTVTAANGVGVGQQASVTATDGTSVGSLSSVAHATSTALGASATTTKANQIILGTSTEVVTHPGGVEYRVQTKTNADYTLTGQDSIVRFSTGAVARVATLPPATAANVGLTYTIKKVDSGAGTVTITADTTGTPDLIDGAATKVLTNQYEVAVLYVAAADVWDLVHLGAP